MDDIDEEKYKEDLLTTSTQIHNRSRASSFSSTGSDMAPVFGMLLRESELLEEQKEELDDQGLGKTMVEEKMDEKGYGPSNPDKSPPL